MLRPTVLPILLVLSLGLAPATLPAATYTLEPNYTQAVFRWDHLGFSSPAAQVAQGSGTLEFDPAQPTRATVTVTMPLSTLYTGVPELDEHLCSDDFFDTARFPTATYRSTRVAPGASPDRLRVSGELTLRGVTQPVMMDVRVVKIGTNPRNSLPTIGFDATARISRSAFGLGRFVPQVGDQIDVHVISQAVDAAAYARYVQAQAAASAAPATPAAKQ